MNEISNMDMYHLLRNRRRPAPCRRDSAIVWPRRPINVPNIPFKSYEDTVRDTFRDTDAANKRFADFTKTLEWNHDFPKVVCHHHPDNGGNCRFHAIPGNCDSHE